MKPDLSPLKTGSTVRRPYVQPANDPAIGQGRPHHNPKRDLDILLTLALTVASWLVPALLLWVAATYGEQIVAAVLGWWR